MRSLWLHLLGFAALVVSGVPALQAQYPVPAPTYQPALEEELAEKAAQSRHAVSFKEGSFSGPGWDLLLAEGRKSRFFLVAEEHGVAEIPAVVRELFRALAPAGYRKLAIEISPPMAEVIDGIVRGPDGLANLTKFFAENPPGVAFFTLQEEAELLRSVRSAVPGDEQVLWGLDYEVAADRYLLDRLRRRAPEGPARAAAEALWRKSAEAWKTVSETHNPAAFFSFSQSPEIFADLRKAWPNPDPESALVIDVLQETLAINQLFVARRNWESNDLRARLNRRAFLRYWNEVRAKGEPPRVLFKFGASHMVRGRNITEVFDLGNLVFEMAEAEGSQSFHVLVVGGTGTQRAVFNPAKLVYEPGPVKLAAEEALVPIVRQALPEGFTLIDLRPLRPLLPASRTRAADPALMRAVHGFDAILILTGSRPSRMLP